MKHKIQAIEITLKKAAAAKQAYRAKMLELEEEKKTYNEEFLEQKQEQAKQQIKADLQELNEELEKLLTGLQNLVEEKHSTLELDNLALQNALKVIELGGSKLDTDTIRGINENFKGNMPTLKILQKVYAAQGVVYDGGLSDFIYDIPATYEQLRGMSYRALIQEGSLNGLASSISKTVKKEGFTFPNMVDEAGYDSAIRQSAGLQ